MGLGCLLSVCVARHARADGAAAKPGAQAGQAATPGGRPAPMRIPGAITLAPPESARTLIPPYMHDVRGSVATTALFPLYFDRRDGRRHERFVLPYYYRRSPGLHADVALGLAWSLRGPDRNTFVLPPFYTHRKGESWGVGLLPLFSTGIFKGHHHTLIPPLLTWIDGDAKKRRTWSALYFDFRAEQSRFWGIFPLLWSKRDESDRFTVIPPLFFRFADDDPLSSTTVVPPFYHRRRKDATSWGLVPLVFGGSSPELRKFTLPFLLFHHATGPQEYRLVTPLLGYLNSTKEGRRWFTPIYQRKRGDRGFDAVAPLFFRTWDSRDMSRGLFFPPIYWHWRDPGNDARAVLPFYVRAQHDGISNTWVTPLIGRHRSFEHDAQTWWVLPTFHYGWDETSWQFNIHPLFYLKHAQDKRHLALAPLLFDFHNRTKQTHRFTLLPLYWNFKHYGEQTFSRALAPLYWDFENRKKQTRRLVGFPLYWDFTLGARQRRTSYVLPLYLRLERGKSLGHSVLNTYFQRDEQPGNRRWQFHFFPVLSFGGGEKQKWWNFLYGLAGYERRGQYRRMRLFWIPIRLR
jgi:hypothetical protein